ncbi:MAG: MraY family glycosyltransferase [Verrucomicrobiales bacterium]
MAPERGCAMIPLALFFAAALASWGLGYPVYRMLRAKNILDKPNERSSHTTPTVRGGGIAIMVVAGVGLIALGMTQQNHLILVAAGVAFALAAISFLDDIISLSARLRFAMQALGVAIFLFSLRNFETPGGNMPLPVPLFFLFMFFWMAGYSNAFNFMDGINGISGGQGTVTSIGSAIIIMQLGGGEGRSLDFVIASSLIGGAALGFLPHNFPRARMFMGDVSSVPLGYLLSGLAAWAAYKYGFSVFVLFLSLHANYILDTGITLSRRIARGEKWYQPHREHFYQRLVRSGKSHSFVTLTEMFLQVGIIGLIFAALSKWIPIWIVPGFALVAWGIYFGNAERLFRASQGLGSIPSASALPKQT